MHAFLQPQLKPKEIEKEEFIKYKNVELHGYKRFVDHNDQAEAITTSRPGVKVLGLAWNKSIVDSIKAATDTTMETVISTIILAAPFVSPTAKTMTALV